MFSKLQRKMDFIPEQYNPGPGFYTTEDRTIEDKIRQKQNEPNDGLGKFPRNQRFENRDSIKEDIGPGSYIGQQKWGQQKSLNKNKKSENTKFKVNSIPSIPSVNMNAGYQEIGDGLLILMKGNDNNDQSNLGPGCYNPNYNIQKKNVISHSIPRQKKIQEIEKEEDGSVEIQFQPKNIPLNQKIQVFQQEMGEFQVQNSEYDEQNNNKNIKSTQNPYHRVFKKPIYKDVNNESQFLVDDNNQQYNLTQLEQKNKRDIKNNQGPEFLDPSIISCFKNVKKESFNAAQVGFNSQAKKEGPQLIGEKNPNLGPGYYKTDKRTTRAQSLTFSKEQKGLSYIKNDIAPAVGEYDPIKRDPSFKPSKSKFGSVFGSGSSRFVDYNKDKYTNPGPGEYTIKNKQPKKNKLRIIKINDGGSNMLGQKNILNKQQKSIDDLSTQEQSLLEVNQNSIPSYKQAQIGFEYKKRTRCTSQFISKTDRFDQNQNIKKQILDDLGPGKYQASCHQPNTFNKKSYNHNIGNLIGNNIPRIQQVKKTGGNKLGPGYYDSNIDFVKKNVNPVKSTFA